jgi:hypothetical protein
VDRHFIYIIVCIDEHKQELQYYYKLIEDDLEEITKEWSVNLLVLADPMDMFDVESPETAPETFRPSNINKTKEVHDLDNTSVKIASISAEEGGDGGEIDGIEVEQNKG